MADRTISIRLEAGVTGFVSNIRTAQRATEDFVGRGLDRIHQNAGHINTVTNQVGLLGLALAGVAVTAVKRFADFDEAMSAVAATGDDARGSIDALTDAAIEAGARTVYSAKEAAGAIENLAKAGVSAADILEGGLDGALDLAAAGAIDVARASEIAATAMTQFNLSGDDMTHVADLLAAGAGKAQGGVDDLGWALKQVGLVANQTGLSIEETTAGLTAFASQGLIGSDAGTSFKAMLQRLTPQSKEAENTMRELGISAYDSSGQFIGLANFADNLQESLRNLTPEQRNSALATIFGSDAVRAATVLYDEGAAGIEKWTEAVNDQGYAAETAATRLDNLNGDLEKLSGALDSAFIAAGSGGNDMLRSLTQNLTALINGFSELPPTIQQSTLFLVGGAGLVTLGVAGLGKLAVAVADTRAAMQALGISARTAGIAVVGVGAVLGVAAAALATWAQNAAEAQANTEGYLGTLDEFGNRTDDTIKRINEKLSGRNFERSLGEKIMGENPQNVLDWAKELGIAGEDIAAAIIGQGEAADRVQERLEKYRDTFGTTSTDDMKIGQFEQLLRDESAALSEAEKQSARKALADKEAGVAAEEVAESFDTTTAALASQTDAYHELNTAQADAAGLVLSVRDAQRNLADATDAATKALEENGQNLDINTEAGRANQAALDDVVRSGWDLVEAMQENGATQEEIRGVVEDTRTRFVNLAGGMGMSADEANALADELNLIPTNVQSRVTVTLQADVASAYSVVDRFIRDVSGRTIVVNVQGQQIGVMGPRGGMNAMAGGGAVVGPGTGTSDSIASWLSNGEYVVKAAAVSRYGRAFMDDVNAQRFSSGGFVGGAPAAGPLGVDSAAIAAALSGMSLTLMIDGQPVRAIAHAEAVRTVKAATSGRPR